MANRRVLLNRIKAAQKTDPNYAHVLLHSLAGIYNHTPKNVRAKRLERFVDEWPELVTACLKTCSQTISDRPVNRYGELVKHHGPVWGKCQQRIGIDKPYTQDDNNMNVCSHCPVCTREQASSLLDSLKADWATLSDHQQNQIRFTLLNPSV